MIELTPQRIRSVLEHATKVNIGIRFDNQSLSRWVQALKRINARAEITIKNEMQRQCAIRLSQKLFMAIATGKYNYQSYHPRYKKWKDQYFPGRKWWELKGDLMRAIQPFKVATGWAAGVPAGLMDSGGKSWRGAGDLGPSKEIAWYGRINEQRRPLFEPETKAFADGEWKIIGRNELEHIGRGWR